MKKPFILAFCCILFSFSSGVYANEFSLFVKTCKSCEWVSYSTPFRLKERCEIARQGVFLRAMTKCLKTT